MLCRNLEELLSTFQVDEADPSDKNAKTIEQMANFLGSTDDVRTAGGKFEQALFSWVPCNYLNHHTDGTNVNALLESPGQSKAFIIALRDIAAGEELYLDYRKISVPSWFKEFCRSRSLVDVESLGYELTQI